MQRNRLAMPAIITALLFSATSRVIEANSSLTAEQLMEQTRQYITNDEIQQRKRVWHMQDGSHTGTPIQNRKQEKKQLRNREHTRLSERKEFSSHGGYGSGSWASGRSGRKGGGRR